MLGVTSTCEKRQDAEQSLENLPGIPGATTDPPGVPGEDLCAPCSRVDDPKTTSCPLQGLCPLICGANSPGYNLPHVPALSRATSLAWGPAAGDLQRTPLPSRLQQTKLIFSSLRNNPCPPSTFWAIPEGIIFQQKESVSNMGLGAGMRQNCSLSITADGETRQQQFLLHTTQNKWLSRSLPTPCYHRHLYKPHQTRFSTGVPHEQKLLKHFHSLDKTTDTSIIKTLSNTK